MSYESSEAVSDGSVEKGGRTWIRGVTESVCV